MLVSKIEKKKKRTLQEGESIFKLTLPLSFFFGNLNFTYFQTFDGTENKWIGFLPLFVCFQLTYFILVKIIY